MDQQRGFTRRLRSGAILCVALAIACGGAVFSQSTAVHAEAQAVRVILSYVPIISNWGPPDASGVVLITYSEGDVRADLVGLPQLADDESYEMWLMHSESGEMHSLARFTAPADGAVTYVDQLLPEAIPDRGWDYVLISVEPEPDPDPAADPRRTITGAIPGTAAEGEQFPPLLPQTGQRIEATTSPALIAVFAGALGAGLLVYVARTRFSSWPVHTGVRMEDR